MALRSHFYDDSSGDRIYNADNFRRHLQTMSTTGYIVGLTNELLVRENSTPDLSVLVSIGGAWIDGFYFEVYSSAEQLVIDDPDDTDDRIDRVVVRLDLDNRLIELDVINGVPATNPEPPFLTRNDDIFEISLAQVLVPAGASSITNSEITDERKDDSVCGRSFHPGGGGSFVGDYLNLGISSRIDVSSSGVYTIEWDVENYDTGGLITAPSTDITIQSDGIYFISFRARIRDFVGGQSMQNRLQLEVNGSTERGGRDRSYIMDSDINSSWETTNNTLNDTFILYLLAGDVINAETYTDYGGAYDIFDAKFELYQLVQGTI